ncbi:unnamed protein product [Ectocarpus sp. 12 AP-2014]
MAPPAIVASLLLEFNHLQVQVDETAACVKCKIHNTEQSTLYSCLQAGPTFPSFPQPRLSLAKLLSPQQGIQTQPSHTFLLSLPWPVLGVGNRNPDTRCWLLETGIQTHVGVGIALGAEMQANKNEVSFSYAYLCPEAVSRVP